MKSHSGKFDLHSVKTRRLLEKIGLTVVVILMIVIVGLPLAWMALSSFKPSTELFKMPPSILESGVVSGRLRKQRGHPLLPE